MKKYLITLSCLLFVFGFLGCSSITNVRNDGPQELSLATADYKVLGPVSASYKTTRISFFSRKTTPLLYNNIMITATKKYPTTDEVVNIKVDLNRTKFLCFVNDEYTLNGIAIDYANE